MCSAPALASAYEMWAASRPPTWVIVATFETVLIEWLLAEAVK